MALASSACSLKKNPMCAGSILKVTMQLELGDSENLTRDNQLQRIGIEKYKNELKLPD